MSNAELIADAREFRATPNLGKDMARELDKAMIYIRRLVNAVECADARITELEAEAKEYRIERIRRIGELQELAEAEARIAELEAGEWEYAQAVITDDDGGLYLGKSFGDDPTRALDEGYVLVRRHVGQWVPVESEGTDD